jgi:hypothetical protein
MSSSGANTARRSRALQIRDFRGIWVTAHEGCRPCRCVYLRRHMIGRDSCRGGLGVTHMSSSGANTARRSRALQIRDFRGILVTANEGCRPLSMCLSEAIHDRERLRRGGLGVTHMSSSGANTARRSRALQIRDFRGILVTANEGCRPLSMCLWPGSSHANIRNRPERALVL